MDRVMVLMGQRNFAAAERELRRMLAEDPDDADAHCWLALCVGRQDRYPEAVEEAQRAIALDPEADLAFYAMASAYLGQEELAKAEQAIEEALELQPFDAANYALLSAIHARRNEWQDSLDAANAGLAIDPEHDECVNLRVLALRSMGRREEAEEGIQGALNNDPEDSFTHANLGWTRLESRDHRKALEHFKEALFYDPNNEYAREGVLTALRARNPLYRLILRYFFWVNRMKKGNLWRLSLWMLAGYFALETVGRHLPGLSWLTGALMMAYLVYAVTIWLATPLSNLLLCFNSYGRLVLTGQEKVDAALFGVALGTGAGGYLWYLVAGAELGHRLWWTGLLLAVACAGVHILSDFELRRDSLRVLAVIAILAVTDIVLAATGSRWTDFGFGVYAFTVAGFEMAVMKFS